MPVSAVIGVLARSMMAGEPVAEEVYARAVRTLGRPWRWLRPLALRYAQQFANGTRPRHRDVVRFLRQDDGFRRARAKYARQLKVAEWLVETPRMRSVEAATSWGLPAIETLGDLAAWLGVTHAELEWFADLKALPGSEKTEHYRYAIRSKRSGGVRLIEIPKSRIKELQRRILAEILDRVPAHGAVHGFVRGRSAVTFAAPHTRQSAVLRMDLQDFFPGSPAARVQALFRTLGYPEAVADRLGGICTNAAPRRVWSVRPVEHAAREWHEAQVLYGRPHLPQGAPTSPALANLTAYRLDCRLSGLARTAGAVYTRYADDLGFSGGDEFARGAEHFAIHVGAIALEEGFYVNHRKTRVMRPGVRQQLAGVVVNEKVNLRRKDLDLLEAILTNCVKRGAASQNRQGVADFRAHLEGRVGYVSMVNAKRGRELRAIFDAIVWE